MIAEPSAGGWMMPVTVSAALHLLLLGGLSLMPARSGPRPAETSISVLTLPSAAAGTPIEFVPVAPGAADRRAAPAALEGMTVAATAERARPALRAAPATAPAAAPDAVRTAPESETARLAPSPPPTAGSSAASLPATAVADASPIASAPAASAAVPAERLAATPAPASPAPPPASSSNAATPPSAGARPEPAVRVDSAGPAAVEPSAPALAPSRPNATAPVPAPVARIESPPSSAASTTQAEAPRTALPETAPRIAIAESVGQAAVQPPSTNAPSASSPTIAAPPAAAVPTAPGAGPVRAAPVAAERPVEGGAGGPGSQSVVAPATETQTALLTPTRNAPSVAPRVDDTYRGVLDFLRRYDGGGCFVAVPSLRGGGVLGLDGFTADNADVAAFTQELGRATGVSADARLDPVSAAQCRVLTFARSLATYPAFSLRFEIARPILRSGERLEGKILNVDGRTLHLLLIDDEGRVQSADGFVQPAGEDATFAAHMTLTGGPVATVQLLVALAVDTPLETVGRLNGEDAERFFSEVTEEIAARGLSPDLAITSFAVR